MIDRRRLIRENNHTLQQAIDLTEQISDELFCNSESPYFASSVGKHIRHILEFYHCFISGWQGKIDYDARKRVAHLENDRQYCIREIRNTMENLNNLLPVLDDSEPILSVKSDEGEHGVEPYPFSQSTIERELQFLKFHAVHHFAIIAMILRIQNFEPPDYFGFAASTIKYLKQL